MTGGSKVCLAVLAIIVLGALSAPFVTPYEPDAIDLDSIRVPPGKDHLMGTDNKGRDVFTRILYGGRISIGVAFFAASLSLVIGMLSGLCSGYFGGKVDLVIMGFVDVVLSFPSLLLAIAISVLLPSGVHTVVIAIAAVGWAPFARIVRGGDTQSP